jgi:hypothetical protein
MMATVELTFRVFFSKVGLSATSSFPFSVSLVVILLRGLFPNFVRGFQGSIFRGVSVGVSRIAF